MAILMKQLANVTITDTETLKSILNTLDAALKGSLSYSLTGEGKTVNRLHNSILSNGASSASWSVWSYLRNDKRTESQFDEC